MNPRLPLLLMLCALASQFALATPATDGSGLPAQLPLAVALARMRTRDPAVEVAQTAVAQAAADRVTAGERPNATFSLSTAKVDLGGHNGAGSLWDKQYDTIVALSQPFERGGKRRHRLAQATASLDATNYDFADTLRVERLAVTQAYWDLKRAQEKRASAHTLEEIERRALQGVEARLQHGDIAALDAERLRLSAAQADNAADQADATVADAQVALGALLDATTSADHIEAIDDWPTSTKIVADASLLHRPDILAAQERVSAAQAALDLAHAQRHRDVTVSAQYEHNPTPGNGPGYGDNMVGIGISIPLFTGNRYQGEIGRANADLDAAHALLTQTNIASRADAGRAIADARAADSRVRRYDSDLVDRARRAEQTSEAAYARGGLSLADLLDARRDLKAVEDAATDARADFADAVAALDAAVPLSGNPQ